MSDSSLWRSGGMIRRDMLPDRFFGGVPKYPFRTLVPTGDDAIKVLTYDGIIRRKPQSQPTDPLFLLLASAYSYPLATL